MRTDSPRTMRRTACGCSSDASRRLARVQKVCDMLQVPARHSLPQQSRALHVAGFDSSPQVAAAAVAGGSCTVDDLLDTVTVLRIECATPTSKSDFTAILCTKHRPTPPGTPLNGTLSVCSLQLPFS